MDLVFLFVLAAPLLVFAIVALSHLNTPRSRPLLWVFRNAGSGWGVGYCAVVALVTGAATAFFTAGACVGGLKGPARCERLISDRLGDHLFDVMFIGQIYLVVMCAPALLIYGLLEWITRARMARDR